MSISWNSDRRVEPDLTSFYVSADRLVWGWLSQIEWNDWTDNGIENISRENRVTIERWGGKRFQIQCLSEWATGPRGNSGNCVTIVRSRQIHKIEEEIVREISHKQSWRSNTYHKCPDDSPGDLRSHPRLTLWSVVSCLFACSPHSYPYSLIIPTFILISSLSPHLLEIYRETRFREPMSPRLGGLAFQLKPVVLSPLFIYLTFPTRCDDVDFRSSCRFPKSSSESLSNIVSNGRPFKLTCASQRSLCIQFLPAQQ
jgi:hypothetical protein